MGIFASVTTLADPCRTVIIWVVSASTWPVTFRSLEHSFSYLGLFMGYCWACTGGRFWWSDCAWACPFWCLMVTALFLPSVLWRCWLGGRKGTRPVKKLEWWGAGVVICLERDADLHMAQLMPLPLTVSCFSKIQIVFFPFWYRPTWVVPEKGPLNVCVTCIVICLQYFDAVGCWKGIWPVKNWAVGCWCGYLSGVRCRLAYGPADATATHCLLLQ